MILKKFRFPIFFLMLLSTYFFVACSNKKNDEKLSIVNYDVAIKKAIALYATQQFDSSFYYFYKAKQICQKEDKDRIVYALYYMAMIEQIKCDFSGSETTATEILDIHPNYSNKTGVYNLLGLAYQEQNDLQLAFKYYNLSLKGTSVESEKNIIINNIGYNYIESKKYDKAVTTLKTILNNDSLINNKVTYAKVIDNLGYAYFKLNNPQSIIYLNQALTIRESSKDDSELIASYMHLGEYYQIKNPTLSKEFAQKAYVAASAINSPDDRIEALKFQIMSSAPTETKNFALKQIKLSDSIAKVRQMDKNQFSKIKYDSKKALQETEKYKIQKQILIIILLLIIVIFILSIKVYKSKNKRKLQIITYTTETRISKKLHDELANDVFNIMTYADTQNLDDPNKKEYLVENLDKIYTLTRNISSENSEIETGNNYESYLKAMLSNYNSKDVNVIINHSNTLDWSKVKRETKIAVYRVLQELMVNMKKHSQSTLVVIKLENHRKTIEISYSDNGIGSSEMLNLKKGLLNAENRILAIKGSITFESETNKGFKSKITVLK
ncbi:hypothetical protein [Flavobacterium sp.]|uniref:tetratricopeptide repeat-containing sensor histidine kinase n=1 Tax=Flavobacterium sp. TaxID=239 RepID=UPI00375262AC